MLNTAIVGLAAAMVMAAKGETSYLNVNDEAFLLQETGITQIVDSEEDLFFGLACRDNGLTAVYVSGEGWASVRVKANFVNEETTWDFQPTGGTFKVN